MTEIIIITLLVSAGVYVWRLARRGWCTLKGQEHPPVDHKPLPIVRLGGYLRGVLAQIGDRLRSRGAGKGLEAEEE